jgi:hypothetical protein
MFYYILQVQMLLAGSRAATLAVLLLLGGCLAIAQNEEQNRGKHFSQAFKSCFSV